MKTLSRSVLAKPPAHRRAGWRARPTAILPPPEVAVWHADLDEASGAEVASFLAVLSVDERERARGFYFERDRRRFIVARGILRSLLGHYLSLAPERIAFRYGANGKPELAGEAAAAGLHFNLAHSEGAAVYAFTRVGEVGIDLERIREMPEWERIAATCLPAAESARLCAGRTQRQSEDFFRAWARQEARLKALGIGLGDDAERGAKDSALHVHALDAGSEFAAALALRHPAPHIVREQWAARAVA
ncbi:MAG TPA: 4'-phosphopantetheinyl transferase superfamily protein [Opitutaceae bacterium]|nr:4'-phosphopantetheinyl transferase superfamily protein [Opitutaceae bacterium]